MTVTKKRINSILLFLFLFLCIFFPGDPYNLKIVILIILLMVNGKTIVEKGLTEHYIPITVIGLLFPVITALQSTILTGSISASIASAYPPIIMLILIPIVEEELELRKYVLIILKVLASITTIIAVADVLGLYDVNSSNIIRRLFYDFGMGAMGKSTSYSSYYRIFFKASPLLVLLLDDSISKSDYIWILISCVALWFSGTRANVISAGIILFFRYIVWVDRVKHIRFLFSMLLLFIIVINFDFIVTTLHNLMNTTGSIASDAVRSGEMKAYAEIFSDPTKLFLGSGFGSEFYNYGRESYVYTSELAFLEIIRCVGIIIVIPFLIFISYPVFSKKMSPVYKVSYVCYLLSANTNPLLFSSTAMIMYLFMYVEIMRKDVDERSTHVASSVSMM